MALTVQPGDRGDTASMAAALGEAGCALTEMAGQVADAKAVGPVETVSEVGVERVVAVKGYHGKQALQALRGVGVRTAIAKPGCRRLKSNGESAAQATVYANRRWLKTKVAEALLRRRGELIEGSFAHLYDTGAMRRVHLRGKDKIPKRAVIHAAAFNLSLVLRQLLRVGTARQAADQFVALCFALLRRIDAAVTAPESHEPMLSKYKSRSRGNRCRRRR